MNISAILER